MALHLDDARLPAEGDAFGRLRVSDPITLFDGKCVIDEQPHLFDDAEVSGSGTSTSHSADTASVTLSVGATTAGNRVRQSRRRMIYQPGKSQLIFMTFTLGAAAAGITRRVGYFDDDNGIFLEQDGDGFRFVRRTSVTGSAADNVVESADWNLDTFPDLDLSKSQILVIDLEWLGVGSVRAGFVIDGAIRYGHKFMHANELAGVYMSTPNLPVRWEIDNDGTGAAVDLECICATVISEGGLERTGITQTIDRGATALTTNNDANLYPLLAIRLKSTALGASALIEEFSVLCNTTATYRWALLLDPTVSGTALSFTGVADSAIEAQVDTTNATTVSGGTVLASGYAESSNQVSAVAGAELRYALGSLIDGTAEIVVLAAQRLAGTTEDFYASLTYLEQV